MEEQVIYKEINENFEDGKIKNKSDLNKVKLELNKNSKNNFKRILTSKPIRTLSGVAPIAVMTKPIACKHGKCTFCPGGPNSYFGDVAQSYTGNEPTTMRAIRNFYD